MKSKIPNILTLSRLVIIPFFLLNLVFDSIGARYIFLFLFLYASLTDFLDGYLARVYNIGSNFGRIFDPIADKALILMVCVIILVRDYYIALLIIIPILVILLRELVISGIREGLAIQNVSIPVTRLAKYKTATQMIALSFLIIGGPDGVFYYLCQNIGIVILYASMVISLITGIQYISATYKDLTK